jgi:fructokinase
MRHGLIVVAGESLIDLIVDPATRVTAVPGGGPYNTARTIGRLGGHVAFLGRLSSDRFGRLLREGLEVDGVDTSLVVECEAPTTLAIAELDPAGAASYHFYIDGTSAPGLTTLDARAVLQRDPSMLHVGTLGLLLEPIGSSLEQLVGEVSASTLVMVDPNCRPGATLDPVAYRARVDRILARADVVKVSTDDLVFLDPGAQPEAAAAGLLERGPSVVLVTNGGLDVLALGRTAARRLEVPRVRVVDTVGSGDAFGGAFLAWWSAHHLGRGDLSDIDRVARAAVAAIAVASRTVERPGADPPRRSELGSDWD